MTTATAFHPGWGNDYPCWLYTPVGSAPSGPGKPDKCYGTQLWPQIKNYKVYFCPKDNTDPKSNPYYAIRQNKLSIYIMNAVNGSARWREGLQTVRVQGRRLYDVGTG
jgi:hypothetical protein